MRVRITPATAYSHGHIEKTLVQCGITPPPSRADGVVEMELSEYQLSQFQLRGDAHHVERLPDVVLLAEVAPAFRVPSVEEVMDLIACPRGFAEEIVERKRLILTGLNEEELDKAMFLFHQSRITPEARERSMAAAEAEIARAKKAEEDAAAKAKADAEAKAADENKEVKK